MRRDGRRGLNRVLRRRGYRILEASEEGNGSHLIDVREKGLDLHVTKKSECENSARKFVANSERGSRSLKIDTSDQT